ncbi:hypothetical protein VTP01DRAFT_10141 [Rhizomucor pusillus]|uniref:uncharacterized protein n=1 Tax=Rhizomucor pusillus TaxID=4840 RepID=UPI0037443D3B
MSDAASTPEVALFEDDPGSLDGVIDDEDEDLKLDNADTKVWLVKLPAFLAERWNQIDEDDVDLGYIRIYNETPPGHTSPISLILPAAADGMPQEYSIHIPEGTVQNKFVLHEGADGTRSVTGTVHHECTATPVSTHFDSYRGIMRKRVNEAETPQRTVQMLGEDNQPMLLPGASSSGFADFIPSKRARTDNKEKATRMPKNELMDILFAAFERYPYWSFKGLIEQTKQPSQYLKEVLSEICILNKRGPYTGNYQLKPEFKSRLSTAEQRQQEEQNDEEDIEGESSGDEDFSEENMETIHF